MNELRNEAGTPYELWCVLQAEYHFTVDACASAHNAKLLPYWSKEQEGLLQSWAGKRVWCNPPYNNIAPWLGKAQEADFACCLLPARTDTAWWRRYKPKVECHYFLGRVAFIPPPGVKYSSNPFACVLFVFGGTPGLEVWRDAKTGGRLPK